MSSIRYRVPGVPAWGTGAFMPVPARLPGNSRWNAVAGDPGWTALPCPGPQAVPSWGPDPRTQGSHISNGTWSPSIYTPLQSPVIGPWTRVCASQNALPIPAVNPGRNPQIAYTPPRFLGGHQIPWPRVFPRWPSITTAGG